MVRDDDFLELLLALRDTGDVLPHLDVSEIEALVDELELVSCTEGEALVTSGEPGGQVHLVLEGSFGVLGEAEAEDTTISRAGPGDLLGGVALFVGGRRVARFRCLKAGRVAAMPVGRFDSLLEERPDLWKQLSDTALRHTRQAQLYKHLDRLFGPFGVFAADILAQLEEQIEWLSLKGGETLFSVGDAGDAAFIVMTGRLRLVVDTPEGRQRIISEIGCGETVGETALLTEGCQTETALAVRDSDVARLSRRGFFLLIERRPRSLTRVAGIMAKRLSSTLAHHGSKRRPPACLSLFAAGPTVPLAEFAKNLMEALGTGDNTILLTSAGVDQALGKPGVSQATETEAASVRLVEWLNEQESKFDRVIYVADEDWSNWSRRCARQSDLVLQVADAGTKPEPSPAAAQLIARDDDMTQRALVLVHPENTDRPRETARWLDNFLATEHYHLRSGSVPDIERLARVVSGKAVGLVLGGGGARGFAEVGVFRALEETGVSVDMIGGSSIGACMGFFAACGMDAETIHAHLRENWSNLTDLTLPLAALLTGRRINNLIVRDCGEWDYEDLWLPFFSLATNLTTARSVVHRRGNGAHGIRATVSIPGILPPVPDGENLLVDGGVMNNLPIDVMREHNPFGTIIAIDVISPKGPVAKMDYGMHVSGWALALDKIMPWRTRTRVPSLAATVMRAMVIGAGRARDDMVRDGMADFYHNIHVRGVGMLQFDAVDKIVDIGYNESIGPLKKWVEAGGLGWQSPTE